MRRAAPLAFVVMLAVSSRGWAAATLPSTGTQNRTLLDSILGFFGTSVNGLVGGIPTYLGNRATDLADCIELNLGFGAGMKASLEYGFGQVGAGYVVSERIGMDGRQVGLWSERTANIGLFPLSLVLAPSELMRKRSETWDGLADVFEMLSLGVARIERENFGTAAVLYEKAKVAGPWHERPGDMFSFGGEVHVLFLGVRMRFKPLEFFDFLLGFFGADFDERLAYPDAAGFPRGRTGR